MSQAPIRVQLGTPVIFVTDDLQDVVRIDVNARTRMKRGLLQTDGVLLQTRSAELVTLDAQQWVHLDDGETVEEREEPE